MIDDEFKAVALIILLASAVISVYPVISEGRIVEPFSELGILGPTGKLGNYTREVAVGQGFDLFIYVGNHEGRCEYYRVVEKVGDQNSNVSDVVPLDASVRASWETVLPSEGNNTIPIRVSMDSAGLNRRLVLELWKYDLASHGFVYDERWTQLWLNVTLTG
ncbi:MAG: DUF1616 domain-containing protein [Candidatus Bathyarchaeia archaeon]|jgi:uncharacterized membrane protein